MSTQDCADCEPSSSSCDLAPAAVASIPTIDPILDPTTFIPPNLNQDTPNEELPRVVIEFCDRCRWLHRATWTLTELFLTFPPISTPTPSGLKAISLLPRSDPETGGRFRVWLYRSRTIEEEFEQTIGKEAWAGAELVWDRKVEGGFPEMKVLKQRIRNLISPEKALGHSDKDAFKKGKVGELVAEEQKPTEGEEVKEDEPVVDYSPQFKC
ncbi:selenoprotein W-related protein, partial [Phenoliferia sp. Uapishka_3]